MIFYESQALAGQSAPLTRTENIICRTTQIACCPWHAHKQTHNSRYEATKPIADDLLCSKCSLK